MAARILIGVKSRAAQLRHLSVVFAVVLRLRIVTELYMRPMSPKQFHEEFGGGTIDRVDKNFKKLAKHGWLTYVRTETGNGRRAAKEHFYRATELAYFDSETWGLLPYSIRVAFSWSSFKQIAERVREGLEVLAEEGRSTGSLTSVSLSLDQRGWDQVIQAVDAQFIWLYEEQSNAKLRIQQSGEEPIRTSVLQFAFESPAQGERRAGPSLAQSDSESPVPFPVRLSKVFADEICLGIVEETNEREMSAAQFHREFGGKRERIRYRFKLLERIGWLKLVGQTKRGAAVERFYRAAGPVIRDDNGPWANVPESLERVDSWKTFEQLSVQVKEAMAAGTFDAREDRYLAWSLLLFDQQGCENVAAAVHDLQAFVFKEQVNAEARMEESGEKPITMTVALGGFESPRERAREP